MNSVRGYLLVVVTYYYRTNLEFLAQNVILDLNIVGGDMKMSDTI